MNEPQPPSHRAGIVLLAAVVALAAGATALIITIGALQAVLV
jgi:hypothetical protein